MTAIENVRMELAEDMHEADEDMPGSDEDTPEAEEDILEAGEDMPDAAEDTPPIVTYAFKQCDRVLGPGKGSAYEH